MKSLSVYALAMGTFIAISSGTLKAQGLFAKAGQQAEKAVAVFESIWDDFYGKMDELLVAEVDKENGDLAFDSEKGIANFTVFLKVNEDAYAKWEQNSWTLLEACGIKEDASSSWQFGRKRFAINDNTASEINRVAAAGELTPPLLGGVIVKLVDKNGTTIQYAALPFGLFRNGKESNGWKIPAFLKHEYSMNGVYFYDNSRDGFNRKDGGSMKPASLFVTFAGVTRKSLLSVEDIRCEVLVAPKFQEECLRLSKEKIEADTKIFAEHGIESKVIMLSGKVPLAVNKTPRGTWFSRYEVTQGQWDAVMGDDNPSIDHRTGQVSGGRKHDIETAHDLAEFFGTASFMSIVSPDMPVDYISCFKAQEFIGKLNALPEVKEAGLVFEMPKGFYLHGDYHHEPDSDWNTGDPQWEYACLGAKAFGASAMERQGVDFGLDLDGNKMELQEAGWCRELTDLIEYTKRGVWNSDMVHPVGMKRPNAFGLYDMIGNVSEMVLVKYHSGSIIAKCPYGVNPSDGYRDHEWISDENDKGKALRGLRLFARMKVGSGTASDQSASSDVSEDAMGDCPELAQALMEAGIKSTPIKGGGGYYAIIDQNTGRKQKVYIFSKVKTIGDFEVRTVSSFITRSKTCPVNTEQKSRLLVKSGGNFLGHLCLSKPKSVDENWCLYYASKVPSNAPALELEATIRECANVADQWEKELVGTDEN